MSLRRISIAIEGLFSTRPCRGQKQVVGVRLVATRQLQRREGGVLHPPRHASIARAGAQAAPAAASEQVFSRPQSEAGPGKRTGSCCGEKPVPASSLGLVSSSDMNCGQSAARGATRLSGGRCLGKHRSKQRRCVPVATRGENTSGPNLLLFSREQRPFHCPCERLPVAAGARGFHAPEQFQSSVAATTKTQQSSGASAQEHESSNAACVAINISRALELRVGSVGLREHLVVPEEH